jgi:hypothetical protein
MLIRLLKTVERGTPAAHIVEIRNIPRVRERMVGAPTTLEFEYRGKADTDLASQPRNCPRLDIDHSINP